MFRKEFSMAYLLQGAKYYDTDSVNGQAGVGGDAVFFHDRAGESAAPVLWRFPIV